MTEIADLLAGSVEPLVIADRGRIRFLVLNRPAARNALTRAMRADFARLLAEADVSADIDALVLTGAGGCFSGGVDLKDRIPGAPPVEPNPGVALRRLAKPTIAAIDGPCITGALEMALSCDIAIATPEARFADTHCKVGLFPRWGGGTLLTSAIGVRRARQMMLTGAMVDASTALAWGLINELIATPQLLDRAAELARAMAERALLQPLSFDLHTTMLDRMAAADAASQIETEMLDRFDRARKLQN
ncbi:MULTISPECIES: enoyl-CoA hydratase-related protein [unclassified Novosphingobium]|uniref:enoyl-CoA hydratase-related protein n=1 Tax=unclassified Novosphingobium TaxID=2644732 RepID=UPI000D2F6F63|nr:MULTISPECIES: enoyl-CoA hydratase-related protein [unclassified Novosphingobium]PTR12572.1 short chain enoyl-CoA hydratase [Novosphingobium sp. GV055]PUB06356.1 short chain enoyl-CoA hydratase [Novosphingobium sp. GV061]PUB22407.1 short chain enoyl-CoA hydratase [Novosphingobium sp. GV079]PUB44432.1 short chain enoyl-CoA hydratase [Novosphingobium sp. GV027]